MALANPGGLQAGDLLIAQYATRRGTFDESRLASGWSLLELRPVPAPYNSDPTLYMRDLVLVGAIASAATVAATSWPMPGTIAYPVVGHGLLGWAFRGEQSVGWAQDILPADFSSQTLSCALASGTLTVRTSAFERFEATTYFLDGATRHQPFFKDVAAYPPSPKTLQHGIQSHYQWAPTDPWIYVDTPLSWPVMRNAITVSTAPATPKATLTAPAEGAFINTQQQSWTAAWQYFRGLCGTQTKWALRKTISGVNAWWDDVAQLWKTTETLNTGAQTSTLLRAGDILNGQTVQLAVAVQGTLGALSAYSPVVTFYSAAKPTASLTIAGFVPATATVADMTPTIIPAGTPAPNTGGLFIATWEGRVTQGVTEVATMSGGAEMSQWTLTTSLTNGTLYRAQVRVQDSAGVWSDWAVLDFTPDVVTPGAPTVAAQEWADPTSGCPGVRLHVTFPYPAAFDWATVPVRLRVEADWGDGWVTTAIALGPYTGLVEFDVFDAWYPHDTRVRWRVRGEGLYADGGVAIGPWSESPWLVPELAGCWLVPYGRPDLALQLQLSEEKPRQWETRSAAKPLIGSSVPVVSSGGMTVATGGFTAHPQSEDEREALVALIAGGHLLMLRMCPEFDTTAGERVTPADRWFRVVGQVQADRLVQGPYAVRSVSWDLIDQPPPWEA